MIEYTDKIRQVAKRLLEKGEVEAVIGYEKGSLPMTAKPVVIRKAEDAERLIWDSNCGMNLCNFLTGRKEKVAVFATGCNSRNIVTHIQEKQTKRESLTIIGVPCTGVVDAKAVQAKIGEREIVSVTENKGMLKVEGQGFTEEIAIADVMQANCKTCIKRNPVISDEMVADEVPEIEGADPYADVREVEAMSDEERWAFFQNAFSECIRCYACRNACPLCYCPTCFVDESKPQWVGKSTDPTDTQTFHWLRAFHCAGRCTDCGACERACPVGLPLRYLTKKLNKDANEIYGHEAGMDPNKKPLFDDYRMTDLNDFIR